MRRMKHDIHGFMNVVNDAEVKSAIEKGWSLCDVVTPVIEIKNSASVDTESDEKKTLIAIAKDAGIKIDKRWSAEKIREELGL